MQLVLGGELSETIFAHNLDETEHHIHAKEFQAAKFSLSTFAKAPDAHLKLQACN